MILNAQQTLRGFFRRGPRQVVLPLIYTRHYILRLSHIVLLIYDLPSLAVAHPRPK